MPAILYHAQVRAQAVCWFKCSPEPVAWSPELMAGLSPAENYQWSNGNGAGGSGRSRSNSFRL